MHVPFLYTRESFRYKRPSIQNKLKYEQLQTAKPPLADGESGKKQLYLSRVFPAIPRGCSQMGITNNEMHEGERHKNNKILETMKDVKPCNTLT